MGRGKEKVKGLTSVLFRLASARPACKSPCFNDLSEPEPDGLLRRLRTVFDELLKAVFAESQSEDVGENRWMLSLLGRS